MHRIQIKLFGTLEIIHGERLPERPDTARVLSLLGYLIAQRGVPQHREKLVDLLWPDQPLHRGRRLLSDALWRARRLLAGPDADTTALLSLVGDAVAFHPDETTWIDVAAFEQFANAAAQGSSAPDAIAQMQAAIDLYRGDFLEDCYDDWAIYERERLHERYVTLLEQLLARYKERGAHEAALQVALRLVRCDELREEGHRELIRLYYLLGREADALRAYERCRTLLAGELGLDPSPETTALYEEILALRAARAGAQETTAGTALDTAASQSRSTPFIGRRAERAALLQALEVAIAGEGGLLLLAAEAGQGKTRLLHEIVDGASWRGAQVSWGHGREDAQAQPLGPLREALAGMLTPLRARQVAAMLDPVWVSELAALLPQLVDVLDSIPPRAPLPPERQLQRLYAAIVQTLLALSRLAPQALLLEDLHCFDRTTLEALEALLPHLRRARVLIILSGRSDELPRRAEVWEMLLRLDHSGLLQRIDLAGMSEDECAELARRTLGTSQIAPQVVARLHAATHGNPFFLLEMLRSLQEQGHLLRDEHGVWQIAHDDAALQELPLPASLRQTIDARVQSLSPHERQALASAAVLGQTFTPTLWARMHTSNAAPEAALPVQPPAELLRRQFLVEDNDGYQFNHSLLREVIYHDLNETERRHLHLRAAEAIEREHVARTEALAQHLMLAGAWARATPYLIQAGDHARDVCAYGDALRVYDQALAAMERVAGVQLGPAICALQLKRGDICVLLGNYDAAIAAYTRVLQLIGADAPYGTQIQALNGLCYVYGLRNDYRSAGSVSSRALELAQGGTTADVRADTLYHAGLIWYRQDEYGEAETYLQEALALYETVGTPEIQARLARCLDTLVVCWVQREGVSDRALAAQERALMICQALGDQHGERECLLSLGNLYLLRGAYARSLAASAAVLPFFRDVRAREQIAQCQYLRGAALYRSGRLEEALEALGEALALCRELGRAAAAQFVQLYLGWTLLALQRTDEAHAQIEQAGATEDRLVRARALSARAELCLERGDLLRAFEDAATAVRLLRQVGAQPLLGRALRVLGQVRAAADHATLPAPDETLPAVAACFEQSAALFAAAHYDGELGETLADYGVWLLAQGRAQDAAPVLQQAQDLLEACGMAHTLERVQTRLLRLGAGLHLPPGVVEVTLARKSTPRGRALRPDEMVVIRWQVEAEEDDAALQQGGKTAQRQARLRRLCRAANEQDAEPTIADLAQALGVTVRTVSRDLAALRTAGEVLLTRGSSDTEG